MTDCCCRGHVFDAANTYYRPDFGWRRCRACDALRWRERQAAKQVEELAQ